jgi:hypothetical protein
MILLIADFQKSLIVLGKIGKQFGEYSLRCEGNDNR